MRVRNRNIEPRLFLKILPVILLFTGMVSGTASADEAAGDRSFSFSGDRTTIVLAKGREQTVLTGNARVASDNTHIQADEIELYGSNFRYLRARGNVNVDDKEQEIHLSAGDLFFDRETEIIRVDGFVEMTDLRNEIIVSGAIMEHRKQDQTTVIQSGVRIRKATDDGEMTCRAEFALYNRALDSLELSGMPVVTWKGDVYRAARIIINLETDEISMEGEVTGTIRSTEKL